jgi:hypothetical protein
VKTVGEVGGANAVGAPVLKDKPTPFWFTVCAGIARFREADGSPRALVRGFLSQDFQALLVYRIFRWFYEHRIPAQPFRFICERFVESLQGSLYRFRL